MSVPFSGSVPPHGTLLHLSLLQRRPPCCYIICILLHEGLQEEVHMLHISEVTMREHCLFYCIDFLVCVHFPASLNLVSYSVGIHIISFLVSDNHKYTI